MIILMVVVIIVVLWAYARMSGDINAGIQREMNGGEWEEE